MTDNLRTQENLPQLIGLAGMFGAGKNTLADYLVDNFGYNFVSTSDMLREISMREYGSIDRPYLQKTSLEQKKARGGGVLVLESLNKPRPLIISDLRSLGEAKEIKKAGGVLVFVDADQRVRYDRIVKRQRDGESGRSFDEFVAGEKVELKSGDSDADFNLLGIRDMADVLLMNNGTPEEFVAAAIEKITVKNTRVT